MVIYHGDIIKGFSQEVMARKHGGGRLALTAWRGHQHGAYAGEAT